MKEIRTEPPGGPRNPRNPPFTKHIYAPRVCDVWLLRRVQLVAQKILHFRPGIRRHPSTHTIPRL